MAKLIVFVSITMLFCSNLYAQGGHEHDEDPHHDSVVHLGPIQVMGEPEKSNILNTVPTVSNLHGDELMKKSEISLGETLREEVGVNSTQFGPSASRPVIRGLGGDRIRILQNGIGVLDASGTSQDHAVPINPLSAESVEIVRGPLNLIYGSSAIGGVVNIVNSRIHNNYYPGFFGAVDSKYDTVNNGRSVSAKFDYGISNFMFHVDGNYIKTDNTDTPLGEIINSEAEQHSIAAGTTWFSEKKDYVGLSYSDYNNLYGVVSEEDVDINLRQQRIDIEAYYGLGGFFKGVRLKSAQSFYKHTELEGDEVGTVFDNTGNETRVEFLQKSIGPHSGIMGVQTNIVELSALGEEAFLPTTDQQNAAVFIFEEFAKQDYKLNAGLRGEWTELESSDPSFFSTTQNRDYTSFSGAVGGIYSLTDQLSSSLNLSYNQRPPTYQELFAQGPHLALGIYEQGDGQLKKEDSLAVEWSLRQQSKSFFVVFTAFNQEFSNFVSLNPTGAFDDTDESGTPGDSIEDFPIFEYQSQRARIHGLELELDYRFLPAWTLGFKGDYLHGQNLDADQPLPRMSPARLGLEVTYNKSGWETSIEWRHVMEQTRTAPQETATSAYNLINYSLSYKTSVGSSQMLSLYFQANNLDDAVARNHISVIKDRVLLPGRNFVLGARLFF